MNPPFDAKKNLSPGQLKWACRRGMLELDVLLNNFLDEAYAELSDEDKALFERFLTCTDPELFAWLMGKDTPTDSDLAKMAEMIRTHARNRFKT